MDSRTALIPGTQLRFGPDTLYTIRGEVGRGSSCIVYDGVYLTHAGDEKSVRIKECYPFGMRLERDGEGALICPPEDAELFAAAREQMYTDFRLCNSLFYAEPASDSIINNLDIYPKNNTVYTVSAYSRENTLNAVVLPSLKDCVSVVKQTAYAIHCIHEAGYLYLDTKPENISVISGYAPRVQLFDFDSLLPLESIRKISEGGIARLSYTKGYAAMELRRGQMEKLGPYTDVYGIGALLFRLLFGRTPEAPDCSRAAVFDFSKMRYRGEEYPDRLLLLLGDFFRKCLAGFYPDRYPGMKQAVAALEEIERTADPARAFLISTPVGRPVIFIGREEETARIEAWHRENEQKVLFVSGMGGIGKSTFVRDFISRHRQEWDSVLFLYFDTSLRQTVINDESLRISTSERYPEENEDDYFERKMKKIREIARRDRVLLVIDNFSAGSDPDLSAVLGLGCRVILITRLTLPALNIPILKLGPLPRPEDRRSLFSRYLGRQITPEETETADAVIRSVSGHTLAIELFARQITESFLSLEEAAGLLAQQGLLHVSDDEIGYLRDESFSYQTVSRILESLFETGKLPAKQKAVLKLTALFPAPGIRVRELARLSGLSADEDIRHLVRSGWITEENGSIWLHPLILEMIRGTEWTELSRGSVLRVLETLYSGITEESHKEEMLLSEACPTGAEDPEAVVTDHGRLFAGVQTAMRVLASLRDDPLISREKIFKKLVHAAVINLPRYEEDAATDWGARALENPENLDPVEILEIAEVMVKIRLEHRDFSGAFALIRKAERFVRDERTFAEYYGLLCSVYDFRGEKGDVWRNGICLDRGILHARKAPHPARKHLLAEFLLGKINLISRFAVPSEENIAEIMRLAEEVAGILEKDCLPFSEIRHSFLMSMAFYYAEIEQDREQTGRLIRAARPIAEKLYPAGLDFIDTMIIPPAIMYLDIGDTAQAGKLIRDGIRICEDYPDLAAYIRKKHELHQCLLDTLLYARDYEKARDLITLMDREARQYDLPDTVQPEVREYLEK